MTCNFWFQFSVWRNTIGNQKPQVTDKVIFWSNMQIHKRRDYELPRYPHNIIRNLPVFNPFTLRLWNGLFHHWIWTCSLLQTGISVKNQNRMANSVDPDETAHTFTRKYVPFAHVILTWLSSTYHLRSAKGVLIGHVSDTAFARAKNPYQQVTCVIPLFCPDKKKKNKNISPHSEHSVVLPLTLRTISNRQTCQKEKCMINRLWYGNFQVIPHINSRHPYQPEDWIIWQFSNHTHINPRHLRPSGWYGCLGLIWGMIWKLPYNNVYTLFAQVAGLAFRAERTNQSTVRSFSPSEGLISWRNWDECCIYAMYWKCITSEPGLKGAYSIRAKRISRVVSDPRSLIGAFSICITYYKVISN